MGNVNVIPAGKVKNVHWDMMNAKYPIVMDMVIVLVANAHVYEDIRENTVKKVCPFELVILKYYF